MTNSMEIKCIKNIPNTNLAPNSSPRNVSKKVFLQENNVKVGDKSEEKSFSCTICHKTYKHSGHLANHMRVHTRETFACNVCEITFPDKRYLKRHMLIHKPPRVCSVCNEELPSRSLPKHMRAHADVKPYTCKVCQKSFSSFQYLEIHMRIHTGDKPFSCNICQRLFRCKSEMKRHIRVHHDTDNLCGVCKENFYTRTLLLEHMRKHTGEEPWICPMCSKSMATNRQLMYHLWLHEIDEQLYPMKNSFVSKHGKLTECGLCRRLDAKYFYGMYVETGVVCLCEKCQNFSEECVLCNSDVKYCDLRTHIGLHTGELCFPS